MFAQFGTFSKVFQNQKNLKFLKLLSSIMSTAVIKIQPVSLEVLCVYVLSVFSTIGQFLYLFFFQLAPQFISILYVNHCLKILFFLETLIFLNINSTISYDLNYTFIYMCINILYMCIKVITASALEVLYTQHSKTETSFYYVLKL